MTFALRYRDVVIAEMHGEVDVRRGTNAIEQRGHLMLDELTSKPDLLAAFGEESARHSVDAQLQGLSAASNVSWINAIVRGIDRSVTLPLEGL